PLIARVELSVAAALHTRSCSAEALARVPRLLKTFGAFDMKDELRKCQFLEGVALKDVGRRTDAIAKLTTLLTGACVADDPLVYGLALAQLGEAQASEGALEDAARSFARAIPLIEEANAAWAIADCKAMLGEILRDQGNVESAIPLYRSAVQLKLSRRLDGAAAYLRIVLAEALMISGREEEGAEEILAALPILGREGLAPAATAALRLLHESARRREADPDAVRRLRLELQKMNERTHS
ncbi:MAG TPA: hypothetical protein VKG23_19010, partial [Thermoanaerobaculia bacterium]|nr:hypothetical protein [Thermoanaerobaculia bacterium]